MSIDDTINQIIPCIYLSGYIAASNESELRKNNIKTILNVCHYTPSVEIQAIYDKLGIALINIPMYDWTYDIYQHFTKTNKIISDSINNGKNILVHCREGRNRAPTIVCAYLIDQSIIDIFENDLFDFLDFIREKRPIVSFNNESFLRSLEKLWSEVREHENELYYSQF